MLEIEKENTKRYFKILIIFLVLFSEFFFSPFLNMAWGGSSIDMPFPRLGMWWLDAYKESAASIARYDLVLNEFDDASLFTKLEKARKLNPKMLVFRPISPSECVHFRQVPGGRRVPNPEIKKLPTCFFLTECGSVLSKGVNKSAGVIHVEKILRDDGTPLFFAGGELAIGDYESALVSFVDIKKKVIKLKRGYVREASDHLKGERVAMHVRFWPETWVMNITAACPEVKVNGIDKNIRWLEYFFMMLTDRQLLKKVTGEADAANWAYLDNKNAAYDGIVIDRFSDAQSWLAATDPARKKELDLFCNNSSAAAEKFDESCAKGVDILLEFLRKEYRGLKIIRNNPLSTNISSYDGQVYETSGWKNASLRWWEALFINTDEKTRYPSSCYLDWFKKSACVMVEVYEDEGFPEGGEKEINPLKRSGFVPNYRRMRFSLASTLLGDGFYSYEAATAGHGSFGLMWFDEYDNAGAGKGYLGMPEGSCEKLSSGVYRRKFQKGMALCNPGRQCVTLDIENGYKMIKGVQAPRINNGKDAGRLTLEGFDGLILLKK